MTPSTAETILCSRLGESAAAWWRGAMRAVRTEPRSALGSFLPVWSAAGRRLGTAEITLMPGEEQGLPFSPQGWGMDECGRALLLLAMLDAAPADTHVALLDELFRTAEIRERQALLRVLDFLPGASRFVSVGIEAVRSSATSVVEAIACDNPYPAKHFPDQAYGQMVLKCLFSGLPLLRVQGLARRRTPELKRMVLAYASERRAAGRTVPQDAALVLEGDADAPV
jgi:hypothetical protein